MEPVRLRLLGRALVTLHDLMPQRPDDPGLLARWGRLRRSTGEVFAALDRYDEACAAFRDALATLPPPAAGALDAERVERAGTLNGMANALEKAGRLAEAAESWAAAAAELAAVATPDAAVLTSRLHVDRNLARARGRLGDRDEAEQLFTAALSDAEALVARGDGQEAGKELAAVLNAYAAQRRETGDLDGARPLLARALPLLLELSTRSPDDRDLAHETAVACMNAPDLVPPGEVEDVQRRGLALATRLAAEFPHTPEYARLRGSSKLNLAITLLRQGRVDEAETHLVEALGIGRALVRDDPGVYDNLVLVGQAGMNLATLRVQLERRTEACAPAAEAIEALTAARAMEPSDVRQLHALAWAHVQEGYGRVAAGEPERALALARAAPEVLPEDAMLRVATAEVLAGCVPLRPEQAEGLAEEALDQLERGLRLGFPDLEYVRGSREFAPVRGRARFEALLAAAADTSTGG
jgi:tetratricopeptide (TPR) repeat protein